MSDKPHPTVAKARRIVERLRYVEARLPMDCYDRKQALLEEADLIAELAGLDPARSRTGRLCMSVNFNHESVELTGPAGLLGRISMSQHFNGASPVPGRYDVVVEAPAMVNVRRVGP